MERQTNRQRDERRALWVALGVIGSPVFVGHRCLWVTRETGACPQSALALELARSYRSIRCCAKTCRSSYAVPSSERSLGEKGLSLFAQLPFSPTLPLARPLNRVLTRLPPVAPFSIPPQLTWAVWAGARGGGQRWLTVRQNLRPSQTCGPQHTQRSPDPDPHTSPGASEETDSTDRNDQGESPKRSREQRDLHHRAISAPSSRSYALSRNELHPRSAPERSHHPHPRLRREKWPSPSPLPARASASVALPQPR